MIPAPPTPMPDEVARAVAERAEQACQHHEELATAAAVASIEYETAHAAMVEAYRLAEVARVVAVSANLEARRARKAAKAARRAAR